MIDFCSLEKLDEHFAENMLREIRLWPKLIQSPHFVHYITSWTEKLTQDFDINADEDDMNAES